MAVDQRTRNLWTAPIVLVLPADAGLIRLARLLASGVGSSLGLPVAEVEDLRVAVDEVCAALVESTQDSTITLEFAVTDGSLVIEGHATSGAPVDEARMSISHQILDAIADDRQISSDDGTIRYRVARRLHGSGSA
jgi:anti-sigma regulatory factor (Ser/Thr protein kinase)